MQFDFITDNLNDKLTSIALDLRNIILNFSSDLTESVYSSSDIRIATYSTNNLKDILFAIQAEKNHIKLFLKKFKSETEHNFDIQGEGNNLHILIDSPDKLDLKEFKKLIDTIVSQKN